MLVKILSFIRLVLVLMIVYVCYRVKISIKMLKSK
jgi:hypothetical protein